MAGFITKEHIEYVSEVFGEEIAELLKYSSAASFLDFLRENKLI